MIVVWMGHADGTPRPGETGRKAALPLLFEAFDLVDRYDPDFDPVSSRPMALVLPDPLSRFNDENAPPEIVFPPDRSEIWSDDPERGFVLAARGEGGLQWYANGEPIEEDVAGDPVWTPGLSGFYELTVVDGEGRASRTRVRVRSG